MREVTFDHCDLKFGIDIKMPDLNTVLWFKSDLNILALSALEHISKVLIEPENIRVIQFDAKRSHQFLHFLNEFEHAELCPEILKKLSEIFDYSFELLDLRGDLLVRSTTFNIAVFAALKAFLDCKVYFTNKFMSFYSTSLN